VTSSEQAIHPFYYLKITDDNFGANETVTVTQSDASKGTLAGDGLHSTDLDGVYAITGTAAYVTSTLNHLTFTPTQGQANTSTTTNFTISVQSSLYPDAVVDAASSVINKDPAVAPTITGAASQSTSSHAPVRPFENVTLADANANATETLTIRLSDGHGGVGGTLSGVGLSGSKGVYKLTGTADAVTDALHALTFTPTSGHADTLTTTTFTLSDKSSAYSKTVMQETTWVTGTSGADTFVFAKVMDSTPTAPDTILDFQHGIDKIDLHLIDIDATTAGLQPFHFLETGAFAGHAGDLIYNADTGLLSGDVDGDGKADFQIMLANKAVLSAGDLVL
jgi:hypothetical protein